jgi:hydroxypyruvate isomerase
MHDQATLAPSATPAKADPDSSQAQFKMSVMLWTLGIDRPFDERLESVAEAGYSAVELAGEYAAWSEDDFRRYNHKRRELGIIFDSTASAMVAPGRARHNASDPRQLKDFLADVRAELELMEKVQCPSMIVMAGDRVAGVSAQTQRESCVEALKRAGELAQGHGVDILLENVDLEENPDYVARSIEDAFQIVDEVNQPRVKLCYDLYHAQISGGNLIANLERHIGLVGKIHIGDVPGHHEPGTGEINFTNIYKKLAELGYDGYVAMEFLPTADPVTILARAREDALRAGKL